MSYFETYSKNCDWFRERFKGGPMMGIYEMIELARKDIENLDKLIKTQKPEKRNVGRPKGSKRRTSN